LCVLARTAAVVPGASPLPAKVASGLDVPCSRFRGWPLVALSRTRISVVWLLLLLLAMLAVCCWWGRVVFRSQDAAASYARLRWGLCRARWSSRLPCLPSGCSCPVRQRPFRPLGLNFLVCFSSFSPRPFCFSSIIPASHVALVALEAPFRTCLPLSSTTIQSAVGRGNLHCRRSAPPSPFYPPSNKIDTTQ